MSQEIKKRFLNKTPSLICGLNTQLNSHAVHLLSVANLDEIVEIDKQNFTATVQAGVKLSRLIKALEQEKVYAQLPAQYAGSIGGLVSGKRYPAFTNQIISMQAILPNGDIVNYGGKFTKNAAGYNLCRLFTGSMGLLGIITKITFKIYATIPPAYPLQNMSVIPTDALFQKKK